MATTNGFSWRTLLVSVTGIIAGLLPIAYVATWLLRVPAPHNLARIAFTSPSAQGQVFPTRPVTADGPARVLPTSDDILPGTVPWKGELLSVEDMLVTTGSRAFVVLQDGELIHEWYADDVTPDTRLSSWSVGKSVVSLLVGQAIDRDDLAEDDLLVDVIPELRTGGAYDTITVGHLLDMASGIDVSENHNP